MSRISKRSRPVNRVLVQSEGHARPPHPRPLSRGGERGDWAQRIFLGSSLLWLVVGLSFWSQAASAQDSKVDATARAVAGEVGPAPVVFTTQQDHQNMLQQ